MRISFLITRLAGHCNYKEFSFLIPPKTILHNLDVGFGSGRDSLYFKNKGNEVYSIDPIKEFCDNGKDIGLDNVYQLSIEDINCVNEFDGI